MSENDNLEEKVPDIKHGGRKRDEALDRVIIEATLDILAEIGFDLMTINMVASRAKVGKASMYRRWPSKVELVKDALIWMSRESVDLENLPDTRNLKNDLLSVLKPYSIEYAERKLKVLSSLGSFSTKHKKLEDETLFEIINPFNRVNLMIMNRAIERGEISPKADIDLASEIIVAMITYCSTTLGKSFDKEIYSKLLDNILLKALKY